MSRVRNRVFRLGTGTVIALALVGPANSEEFGKSEPRKAFKARKALEPRNALAPRKTLAPVPFFDWTGFYIGGHTGFGRGASSAVLTDPAISAASGTFGGVIGGVQAGYNVRLPSGLL